MTRKAKDLAAGRGTQEVFSGDEWEDLSKAISEVSAQSRERIEEIAREKEYHQAILGGMTEGVLLVDRRGRTLLVNEALKKLIAIPTNVNDKNHLRNHPECRTGRSGSRCAPQRNQQDLGNHSPFVRREDVRSECGGDSLSAQGRGTTGRGNAGSHCRFPRHQSFEESGEDPAGFCGQCLP